MRVLEAVREALRTLRSQWLRTALTMFGVVWGTASVVFLLAWGLGVQRMLEDGYARVGKNLVTLWPGLVGEDYSPAGDRRWLWLTMADVEAVRRRARLPALVVGEARMWRVVSFRQRGLSLDVRGVEPGEMALRGVRLASGRTFVRDDLDHRRRVAVLGDEARHRLLGAEGGVGSWVRIGGTPFQVIGFLAPIGTQLWQDGPTRLDEQVWIPLTAHFAFGRRYGADEDIVDTIALQLADRRAYDDAKREVRAILATRLRVAPTDEEAIRAASPIDALRRLPIDQMGGLLLTIGATTLVIGGVGILNMMLDSVYERRQEIGVRLAVGARRRDILTQFFLETFVITGLGGLVGIALGLAGCWGLARLHVPDLVPIPIVRPAIVTLALGVMAGVGAAAGVVPAWRAARIDPALTLRAE
jgi:putative ABC transport system permease protein